ncbi:HTH-type transcriptional activator RhaS [Pontiella sulfatireligans]|uniref:HTH-type transcriptional activator RhaS n=2 Tax=Pontiella sulfatireligans TaxID=2750658 RepID=A0A6C2UDE1_9BACT|nr:HTH-type transcriptional activator RhaS [Pontiella sulfatireligans]
MYPHTNPGMEIVLAELGRLDWAVERIPESLNPGSVFFTLPWQVHGSLKVREPRNKIFFVLFELAQIEKPKKARLGFPASLGFSAAEEKLVSDILVPAQRHSWPASGLLRDLFPKLIQKLNGNTRIEAVAANALLRAIIVELAGIVDSAPASLRHMTPTMTRVQQFLQTVVSSLDHPWTLDEMASSCSMKRTHFANSCKQLTGYPPMLYLNRVRFERACELLKTTETPITDIAFECGYNTSQYFAESFKRFSRMTPSDYRSHLPQLDAIMASNWNHPEERSIEDEIERSSRLSCGRN